MTLKTEILPAPHVSEQSPHQEISYYLTPPLPRPNLKQRGGLNTTFWLAGQIFRKSLKKNRACGGQNPCISPCICPQNPKNFAPAAGKIPAFPLVYVPSNQNFFAPAASKFPVFPLVCARTTRFFSRLQRAKTQSIQWETLSNSPPQARKILGFGGMYKGKSFGFGPPQARKF